MLAASRRARAFAPMLRTLTRGPRVMGGAADKNLQITRALRAILAGPSHEVSLTGRTGMDRPVIARQTVRQQPRMLVQQSRGRLALGLCRALKWHQ
jgi:hypothetical protein